MACPKILYGADWPTLSATGWGCKEICTGSLFCAHDLSLRRYEHTFDLWLGKQAFSPGLGAPEKRFADLVADRAGFEPAVAVTPRTLSKRVP